MLKLIMNCNLMSIMTYYFKTSHVKVNRSFSYWCDGNMDISKHPMLKLIFQLLRLTWIRQNYFKTSHVKVNPSLLASAFSINTDFKTSHVKVNLQFCAGILCKCSISKHPMLKLIYSAARRSQRNDYISKHPMLKLIQRISCIPYNTLYQIPQYLSTFLKFLPATAPFAKKIYKITAMPLFLRIHAILH